MASNYCFSDDYGRVTVGDTAATGLHMLNQSESTEEAVVGRRRKMDLL